MKYGELTRAVAGAARITHVDAKNALDAACATIAVRLRLGEEVVLPGIGKLVARTRLARTGRNPRTGEPIEIPQHRALVVVPSAQIKAALNALALVWSADD